jgi:hypothetical protein
MPGKQEAAGTCSQAEVYNLHVKVRPLALGRDCFAGRLAR